MSSNIAVGKYGEGEASKHLEKNGYRILERNFKRPWGEIDIICDFKGVLVFIEVKTQNRGNKFFIRPEENITLFKQKQLIKSAKSYLAHKNQFDRPWQIDVIAVELGVGGDVEIRHLENAVSE